MEKGHTHRQGYTMGELEHYMKPPCLLWPSFERLELRRAVNMAACGAGYKVLPVQYIKLPGDRYPRWARYFLQTTQGGALTGEALVLWYSRANRDTSDPGAALVAICKHETKLEPGANPQRGWHPQRCTKCGMDLTYDSGD